MACGTTTAYRNGCRCDACRAAQSTYNASYHAANREKLNAAALARRNADPEHWRANFRDWWERNKEYGRARVRSRYWSNPAAGRARVRRWNRANPAKVRAASLRYHWRSCTANGVATASQIAARIAYFGGMCSYCLVAKHEQLDHATPLTRGGTNWPANLRTSCASCNSSKKTMTAREYLASRRWLERPVVGPATFAALSWIA